MTKTRQQHFNYTLKTTALSSALFQPHTKITNLTVMPCSGRLFVFRDRTGMLYNHHQRSSRDEANIERDHASPLSKASSPAARRGPAISADQSSTGKVVVPVRACAECSARAVSRLLCAASITGIGEFCSVVSRRMCEASLTPPSMANPSVPSNLLCSSLSPYESHLRRRGKMKRKIESIGRLRD